MARRGSQVQPPAPQPAGPPPPTNPAPPGPAPVTVEERQARLLSAVLLGFLGLIQVTILIAPAFASPGQSYLRDPVFVVGQSVVVVFLVAYVINRRGHHRLAAWILVVASVIAPWFVILGGRDSPYGDASPGFLLFATLWASLFLRARHTLAVAIIQFTGALALPPLPGHGPGTHIVMLILLGVFPPLVWLSSRLREQALERVEAQSAQIAHDAQELQRLLVQVQQSEERFRVLSQSAVEGIAIHAQGRVLEANLAFTRMFGYAAPSDLVGRSVQDLIAPESWEDVQRHIAIGGPAVYEMTLQRRDGTHFPGEAVVSELTYHGQASRVVAVRDLTERRRQEEMRRVGFQREQEILHLQQLNAFKTHLLNSASHELNTPLTPIKMQLHLLRKSEGEFSERQRHSLQILDRNLDRLAAIVHDFLDVARLQSDRLVLRPQDVDLDDLVAQVVAMYPDPAVQQRVHIHPSGAPLHVRADPARLTQVLINLLSNAGKYAPDGALQLTVARDLDRARVELADHGVGLTPDQAGFLFIPFSQLHQQEGTDPGGTGLGLYIAKSIVEAHAGKIGVRSGGHGQGSTFWFELPLAGPPMTAETPKPVAAA